MVRFTASPETARFGLGMCGSISETLSTAGFGSGSCPAGVALPGAFFAVIDAKADLAAVCLGATACAGFGVEATVVAALTFGTVAPSFLAGAATLAVLVTLVVLELLAGLAAVRERVDDLAESAGLAALFAGALSAGVLVVVFVGI
jgi:hypothetical protein